MPDEQPVIRTTLEFGMLPRFRLGRTLRAQSIWSALARSCDLEHRLALQAEVRLSDQAILETRGAEHQHLLVRAAADAFRHPAVLRDRPLADLLISFECHLADAEAVGELCPLAHDF